MRYKPCGTTVGGLLCVWNGTRPCAATDCGARNERRTMHATVARRRRLRRRRHVGRPPRWTGGSLRRGYVYTSSCVRPVKHRGPVRRRLTAAAALATGGAAAMSQHPYGPLHTAPADRRRTRPCRRIASAARTPAAGPDGSSAPSPCHRRRTEMGPPPDRCTRA